MNPTIPNLGTPAFEAYRVVNAESNQQNEIVPVTKTNVTVVHTQENQHGTVTLELESKKNKINPEDELSKKINEHYVNNLRNGNFTVCSSLTLGDKKVPPLGKGKYSNEERERLLKKIATIETGCLLVLGIFEYEIDECFQALMKMKIFAQNAICKVKLKYLKSLINCIIGGLSSGSANIGKYDSSLGFKRKGSSNEAKQHQSIKSCEHLINNEGVWKLPGGGIEDHDKCEEILNHSNEGRRLAHVINLLKDFIAQDFDRLYAPLTDSFNQSNPFPFLYRRLINLRNEMNLGAEYEHSNLVIDKKYSPLLINYRNAIVEFCDAIIPELESLKEGKNHASLGKLWIVLETYSQNKKCKKAIESLIGQITFDKDNDENQDIIFFDNIFKRYYFFYNSLYNATLLTLVTSLIVKSKVSNFEIDNCIENLLKVVNSLISHKTDSIEHKLIEIPEPNRNKNLLSKYLNLELQEFRNDLKPYVHHLEIRFQRCQKNPNDQIERALILRDALNMFGGVLLNAINVHKQSFIKNKYKLLDDPSNNSIHLEVYQDILNLLELKSQGFEASIQGIKALIGRCFIQIEKEVQQREESAKIDFEFKKLQAQQAEIELLTEKKLVNKKKKKKKASTIPDAQVSTPQVLSKETASDNLVQSDQKSIPIDVKSETAVKKVVNVPAQTLVAPKVNITKAKNLPNISTSLAKCEQHLQKLEKIEFINESCWQRGQFENLDLLLENLRETAEIEGFTVDRIFEQRDLLRRSVEALLEVVTIFSDIQREKVQVIGHDTEKLVYLLIEDPKVPENIKKLIWTMRNVPFSLADVNRCVNYPAEANAQRKKLNDAGRQLVDFLMKVQQEGVSQNKNDVLRSDLASQQKNYLQRSVYFIEQLLGILCDPNLNFEGELPLEFHQKVSVNGFQNVNINLLENIPNNLLVLENLTALENINIPSINNREGALAAIDTALVWIGIRCLAPVEGYNLVNWRTQERNIALTNVAIYLRRLKEKMSPDRSIQPMLTIFGQLSLIRRALKELTIGALYHTDSLEDGQHIIQARDIRFSNSPNFLMSVLHSVSTCSKDLPMLGNWMHRAHKVLSYPTLQEDKEGDFSAIQLQTFIFEVYQASKAMRVNAQETLILSGGAKQTPEKRFQERIRLVETNEKERIFPALASLLYILKFGLSIPRLAQLNADHEVV
jgi:hypothetical protein